MTKQEFYLLLSVAGGLALLIGVVGGTGEIATAATGVQCVNQTGTGCDAACGGCFDTVQGAIDASAPGAEVRIAGGSYTDPSGTVISITKEIQVTGGWDASCGVHDPELYPVVLDARRLGSVAVVDTAGEVGLFHLILTGGNGTGNCTPHGCGGGLYADGPTLHLHHSTLVDNRAHISSTSVVSPAGALGGGVYAANGAFDIRFNRIVDNVSGDGGSYSYGGGVYVGNGTVELVGNDIARNLGSVDYSGSGGVHLGQVGRALVESNTIRDNESNRASYYSAGGGVLVMGSSDVHIEGNLIQGNSGGLIGGIGGGVYINGSEAHVSNNVFDGNVGGSWDGRGDGVAVYGPLGVVLSNNLFTRNHSDYDSEAVYLREAVAVPGRTELFNNTMVGNGDRGVVLVDYADAVLVNNIIASHGTGITQTGSATGTIDAGHNLLWNGVDSIVGADAVLADPLLGPTYYPRAGSPALDAGAAVGWLTEDLDHNPRPEGSGWDIGAFEGARCDVFLPLTRKGDDPKGLLFFDDFQDGTLSGWSSHGGVWVNAGENTVGYYPLGNAWNIYERTGDDFAYEATVNLVDGNAVGLTFRSSEDGTASYDVILDAVDGVFKISRRPPYQVLASHSMTVERGRPYRIRVEAEGGMIHALLDGVHLLSVSDATYTDGYFGVILFQATATYDNVVVSEFP